MKIILEKRELPIVSGSILRTMDTGADEWNCIVPWVPGEDKELDEIYKPRSLAAAKIYIGDELLITGYKYITEPALENSSQIGLGGFSKTMQMIMSNPKESKSFINESLFSITEDLAKPFSLKPNFDETTVTNEVYELFTDQITIDSQSKVFDFLANLAKQKGILLSSDPHGNPYYLKATPIQEPVALIIEGDGATIPVTNDFKARFDDTEIFQTYQVVSNLSEAMAFYWGLKSVVSKDMRVKVPSFKTVVYDSMNLGAGKRELDFARNKSTAQSMSIPFQVNSWYTPRGDLWREGTTVTVKSPSIFVPDGFTFLIRAVQYNYEANGETAVLSLVPPSLYTNDNIDEPWA